MTAIIIGVLSVLLIVLLTLFARKELLSNRKRLTAGLSGLVLISSIGLYAYWSDFYQHYIDPFNAQEQTEFLIDFEKHLLETSAKTESWILLANMYASREQHHDAVRAYQAAEKAEGLSASDMVEYAEERFLAADQQFDDQAIALLDAAVKQIPNDQKALWMGGFAYFSIDRYGRAIALWERLTKLLQDQPKVLVQVERQIVDAKALQAEGNASSETAQDKVTQNKKRSDNPEPTPAMITVKVSLAPELAKQVSGDEVLFIYARAVSGMPAPLAIKRLRASQLPITVKLSNRDAMITSIKLEDFEQVKVIARISQSGQARMQKGNFYGESQALQPSANPTVQITINQIAE